MRRTQRLKSTDTSVPYTTIYRTPEGVAVHGEGAARPAAEGRAEFGREFEIRRPERVRIEMAGRGTDRLECLRARSRGVVHILGPDRDCDVVDTGQDVLPRLVEGQ